MRLEILSWSNTLADNGLQLKVVRVLIALHFQVAMLYINIQIVSIYHFTLHYF